MRDHSKANSHNKRIQPSRNNACLVFIVGSVSHRLMHLARRMKGIIIIILWLLPVSAHCLTDREAYELLSQKSEEIKTYPFHVYITHDHGRFQGTSLPISAYDFFRPYYDALRYKQPDEIFATYQFSQGTRWKCFLLRVPGMYDTDAVDLWVFDTERNTWQKPLQIADRWGDAGYSIDVQAWIKDINEDGHLDIVKRTTEECVDMGTPNSRPKIENKDYVYIWDEDHFRDASGQYLQKLNLKEYQFHKAKQK